MPLDYKDAERIARDLIAEIASEWADTPSAQCVQENGSYVFILSLHPTRVVRHARLVERPASDSTLHFNPLAEATELVALCAFMAEHSVKNAEMLDFVIRDNAKRRIHRMLILAPDIFSEAMWQARIITDTLVGLEVIQAFGNRPDLERGRVNATVDLIADRVRQRFGRISAARNPKINPLSINTALRAFLPQFKESGEIPSLRRFAKQLGVTPKGWRTFLKTHNLAEHEIFVKQSLEHLSSDPD